MGAAGAALGSGAAAAGHLALRSANPTYLAGTFDADAVRSIARKALARGTGARGLRAVLEELMRDVMFEIPSRDDVREVVITPECVTDGIPPLLVLHPESKKKEA